MRDGVRDPIEAAVSQGFAPVTIRDHAFAMHDVRKRSRHQYGDYKPFKSEPSPIFPINHAASLTDAAGACTGLTRSAQITPAINKPTPTSVNGFGAWPRRMKV